MLLSGNVEIGETGQNGSNTIKICQVGLRIGQQYIKLYFIGKDKRNDLWMEEGKMAIKLGEK